jgi:LuxR family transcriptional activator of conjugal transfer of Ti plasmids
MARDFEMSQVIQNFVDSLTRCTSTECLVKAMSDSVSSVGMDRFAYVNFRFPGPEKELPLILTTYPRPWLHRYVDQDYAQIDPVLKQASHRTFPFLWDTDIDRDISSMQQVFFDEAQTFDIYEGVTIPIFGDQGRTAALTLLGGGLDPHFNVLTEERLSNFHLLALYFHASFLSIDRPALTETSPLTPRERDCLTWAARGKTKWEIAVILGISRSTVSFHLKNAQKKYETYSVVATVARAIQSNDIAI